MDKPAAGEVQRRHYEAIHDAYEAHYFDEASMRYRERFFYRVMFDGLHLDGKDVVELACGSGYNAVNVRARFPRARLTGLDVSSKACAAFERVVGAPCLQFDLTSGADPGLRADIAYVVGGLHHCVADLPATFRTLALLLRPGGRLIAVEPNREFVLESLRRAWYRSDRYFDAETERALSADELARIARGQFACSAVRYMGGPAYFLVLNSLVTRVPLAAKRYTAPPLFALESLYNRVPGKRAFPYFVSVWERLPGEE